MKNHETPKLLASLAKLLPLHGIYTHNALVIMLVIWHFLQLESVGKLRPDKPLS